jgi:amino acid transporter
LTYSQIAFAAVIGLGFKIFGKTRFYRSKEVDLFTDLDFFEALDDHYQRVKDENPPATVKDKIIAKMF